MRFDKIVFPVDFSGYSRACLARSSEIFAGAVPEEAHFVHVRLSGWKGDTDAEVEGRLREEVRRFDPQGPYQAKVAVVTGHPSTEICRYARENDCDLIVLATHGRTGLGHMLLGSTAEQVVRHAPCAVITMRVEPTAAAELIR